MTATYTALVLAFVGLLWWFNSRRQKRLDADPAQQKFAAMLTDAVRGSGINHQDLRAELARISSGAADRRVRLSHAVLLVRSDAAPDLYARVLELSREL